MDDQINTEKINKKWKKNHKHNDRYIYIQEKFFGI